MAYSLHIERQKPNNDSRPAPISLEEWQAAVSATEGVRLFAAQTHTITNPKTGEVISIPRRDGDVEVFFPDIGEWRSVFRWRGESAVFDARFPLGDKSHPVWLSAVTLASRLGAVIRGDEGEIYDLRTGKIADAS